MPLETMRQSGDDWPSLHWGSEDENSHPASCRWNLPSLIYKALAEEAFCELLAELAQDLAGGRLVALGIEGKEIAQIVLGK